MIPIWPYAMPISLLLTSLSRLASLGFLSIILLSAFSYAREMAGTCKHNPCNFLSLETGLLYNASILINQSINQSTNQSIDQSINQSISNYLSIYRSTYLSIHVPIYLSIMQPTMHSVILCYCSYVPCQSQGQ